MALPLFKERRFSPRKQLTGLMPGKLSLRDQPQALDCKLIDVSEHGIGIVTAIQLQTDTALTLSISDREIYFRIAWGQPGFGKRNLYRYGLVCLDPTVNVEKLFEERGCLK